MGRYPSPLDYRGRRRKLAVSIFFIGVGVFILSSIAFFLLDESEFSIQNWIRSLLERSVFDA